MGRDNGTAMTTTTGDVPDGLYGTGVFDYTLIRAAVRTHSLAVGTSRVIRS